MQRRFGKVSKVVETYHRIIAGGHKVDHETGKQETSAIVEDGEAFAQMGGIHFKHEMDDESYDGIPHSLHNEQV